MFGGTLSLLQSINLPITVIVLTVCEGWLDVADTVFIPSDLSARLAVAEGLMGASDDEWLDYCGMFARAARPVKLSQISEYKGLARFAYTCKRLVNAHIKGF